MQIYKKLFSYVPIFKRFGYLSILLSSLSAALLVWGYYILYQFLCSLLLDGRVADAQTYALRSAVTLTLAALVYYASGICSHILAFRLETQLRKKGIDGLTRASFRFFDTHSSGFIRKTIDDNAAKTHATVAHMIPDNQQAFLIPLFTVVLAFAISIRVGIAICLLIVACGLILKGMMGHGEFMQKYRVALDKLSAETVEYVRGIQVVKIFGSRLESFRVLFDCIHDYANCAYNYSISCKTPYVLYQFIFLGLIALLMVPLSFFIEGLSSATVASMGATTVGSAAAGSASPDSIASIANFFFSHGRQLALELIMLFFLAGVIMVAFMKIMWASMNISEASYAITTLETLYQEMQADQLNYGKRTQFDNYDIAFNNVSFSYGDKKVLSDLSFELKQNRSYALVGHSGSGKSTIAKLISGFYTVEKGSITIGGYPLEEYTKEALLNAIAFVFQDTKLFKRSLYDNVALAKKDATREEVMRALQLAGCDEILDKFPHRENTIIGSEGVYLSGGEKQRIAIARAMLKDAKIVIMDEASASIDADNEYKLQRAFKNLMHNKTVIMIAHRLTSIQGVDEVLVVEGGSIVERGTTQELLLRKSLYHDLFSLYTSANSWRLSHEEVL